MTEKHKEGVAPDARCPECQRLLDAATDVASDQRPRDGDWSICLYCQAFLVFRANGRLRPAAEDEKCAMMLDDDVLRALRLSSAFDGRGP